MSTFADVYISSLGCLCVLSTLCIISTHCIVSIPPTSLATVPLRRLAFYSSSAVLLVAFEVTKHVIAETEGGVTTRDVSFLNHVPNALVYSLNKFAPVSLYIFNYFSLAFTSYFSWPTLESYSGGGVPKDTPFPVLGLFPGSTQLWGSLPASLFRRVFPTFRSPPIRLSQSGLDMLQVTLQL